MDKATKLDIIFSTVKKMSFVNEVLAQNTTHYYPEE
jgi:hypothetical protein